MVETKHRVKIWGTSSCMWCEVAKEFMEKNKVTFTYIDVGENQGAAKEMIEKTGQMGVPVIEVDGEFIIGFDETKIRELLGL
ncbi:MAG: glutaredoxin family protein [archaeon]